MTINAVAPFVLTPRRCCRRSRCARRRRAGGVVTSREGQFYARDHQAPAPSAHHMGEGAALNCWCHLRPCPRRTGVVWSAWTPAGSASNAAWPIRSRAPTRSPPLTLDDGVARVTGPLVVRCAPAAHAAGVLWKDFRVAPW